MTEQQPKKISKSVLRTIDRYVKRMERGERIMRDASGKLQWASGKRVGERSVAVMLEKGIAQQLDADLFGDLSRGQTIGLRH